MHKVFRVDVQTGAVSLEGAKPEYRWWGQRGLIAKVMEEEVDPSCDPLGPDNKLIICTGLFAGTQVPAAHRLSFGAKSPLTNGIKESNVGGNAAFHLARHGIKMIIVEGQPTDDEWYLLKINRAGEAELVPAGPYLGLNTYELCDRLYDEYGKDIAVCAIGAAGERQYKIAAVMVSDHATKHPCRAAGRGGLGAVMGSKHIKAIVIERAESKCEVEYADKDQFDAANAKLRQIIRSKVSEDILNQVGTIGVVDFTGNMGVLPVRNFSGAKFDRLDQVGAQAFLSKLESRGGKKGLVCQPGCMVKCHNYYCDEQGTLVTGGLEYETVCLVGPNCEIGDLDYIAEVDRACDDLGVDSIEVGDIIGVCMEAGKLAWGDVEAARDLIRELVEGTEFGDLMGMGTEAVGLALGVARIPTVKGQSLPAYDPRNLKAMGIAYATTPMGADHTAGHPLGQPECDPTGKEGQPELSRRMQVESATWDNMGCLFNLGYAAGNSEILPGLMAGLVGGDWTLDQVMRRVGIETILTERRFNEAAGFTAEDDRLPEFFCTEKAIVNDTVFDIEPGEMAKANEFEGIYVS